MRAVLVALALLLPAVATAQNSRENLYSTKAIRTFGLALTDGGEFGAPRYTTTLRPTCSTKNIGAVIYNTTTSTVQACDGSSWASIGISSPVSGDFVATGKWTFGSAADAAGSVRLGETASCIVFEGSGADANETSFCAANPSADITLNIPALSVGTYTVAALEAANVFTGRNTFGSAQDAANAVDISETAGCVTFEGSSADTIEARLCVTNPTVGDATFNLPNAAAAASRTLVTLEGTSAFTGQVNLNSGASVNSQVTADTSLYLGTIGGGNPNLSMRTAQTPDTGVLGTGTTSNSWNVMETGDVSVNMGNGPCGGSACTNPQVVVHDKDQNTDNFQAVGLPGLSGGFRVTLTEGAATSIVTLAVPAATSVSGQLLYTVHARDGTNSQTRSGRIIWNAVAEGTNSTCVVGTAEELDNTPTGTLTATVTCDDTSNNSIALQINATSDLTQTTLEAYGTLITVGSGEPLPQ